MRRSRVAPLKSFPRAVIRTALRSGCRLPAGYRPCFFDIPPHLLDQIVDRREAPLAAQALDELDRELLAVEIALPVDEVGLDQLVAAGLELGPHADVDGRRHPVGPCRVHPVAGNHVALRRHEVGGWEAQLAPALVAVDDLAAHGERVAQQLARVFDRAAEHEPADVARRDDLTVDLEQRLDVDLEAPVGGQHLGVALRPVAEAEVLPHRDALRPEPLDEHVVEEVLRAALAELAVERDDDDLLHAQSGHQLGLAVERGQQLRSGGRLDDRDRVRLERQHGVAAVDDPPVAEVDAVERADRHAAGAWLGVMERDRFHPRNPTTGLSTLPSRGSAIAIAPASSDRTTGPGASPGTARPWMAKRA